MLQVCSAGLGSTLPAASTARTRNSCVPKRRFEYVLGDVQAANGDLSKLHWKVASFSLDTKEKAAVVLFAGLAGADVIRVSGGVVFSVQVRLAGVGSRFPAASRARTRNV